ncbi:MAG: type II toxin-antitoxin system VapC family toxin [Dehalococcoidia bacterium]
MRLYLDANAIIYSIEAAPPARDAVIARILQAEQAPDGLIITSRLSRLACRVKPLRELDSALLATYDAFFSRRLLKIVEVSAAVIERATELRSRYGFRTPDAIHLATAVEESADVFLTGDTRLSRCTEVRVEVL